MPYVTILESAMRATGPGGALGAAIVGRVSTVRASGYALRARVPEIAPSAGVAGVAWNATVRGNAGSVMARWVQQSSTILGGCINEKNPSFRNTAL